MVEIFFKRKPLLDKNTYEREKYPLYVIKWKTQVTKNHAEYDHILEKIIAYPWLVWPSGLSTSLRTERSPV